MNWELGLNPHQRASHSHRRLLIVAFHFPPLQGSTGIHRTLAFSRYLQHAGWEVTVLTAHERAYPEVRQENIELIPENVGVARGFALDTQKHMSIFGRYPEFLAVPDRLQSWILGGTIKGLEVIRKWSPAVILSTYPLASAHRIGYLLHRMTRIPWIADFRDPMLQDTYPSTPRLRKAFETIERSIFRYATRVTVTTRGTADLYARRYPEYPENHIKVIPNGFDEKMLSWIGIEPQISAGARRKLRLVHSGLLYPHERNPVPFFDAVSELKREGRLDESTIEIVLRGSGNDRQYQELLDCREIGELIKLLPPIPYMNALMEISSADACLIFQGATCNHQIPAKIYECLCVGRPILALTDADGDTAALLRSVSMDNIVPMDNKDAIKKGLLEFLELLRAGKAPVAPAEQMSRLSRKSACDMLAQTLDEIVAERSARDGGGSAPQA